MNEKKEDNDSITVSKNMMLSISVLLSALILSGTMFLVSSDISNKLNGLTIAGNLQATGTQQNTGSGTLAPTPSAPTPSAPSPSGGTVSLADTSKGFAGKLGNDDAPIVIVEYSDFQCPFCRSWFNDSKSRLQTEYIDTGKVQLVYKDFPLSFHPMAQPYAEAARCAGDQGKFWEFHDKIFEEQSKFGQGTINNITTDDVKKWAANFGLNTTEFNSCLDTSKYSATIQSNFSDGSAAGVSGTPSFIIGTRDGTGQLLVGAQPYSNFKSAIDALLS